MKGLMLKDWYLIKKYFKSYLFVIAAFTFVSFFSSDNEIWWTFTLYPCLICSAIPITLLGYDEKSRWDRYSAVMPYTRTQLVSSKYVISLIAQVSVITFLAFINAIVMIKNDKFDFGQYMTMILAGFVISIIVPAIWLPLVFKLGIEKGRWFFVIITAVAGGGIASLGFIDIDIEPDKLINVSAIVYVLTIVAVALYALSWYLSIVFYKKKEL